MLGRNAVDDLLRAGQVARNDTGEIDLIVADLSGELDVRLILDVLRHEQQLLLHVG